MRRSFYIRTHRAPFHKISKYEQRMSNCKQVHDLAKISAQPSPALPCQDAIASTPAVSSWPAPRLGGQPVQRGPGVVS